MELTFSAVVSVILLMVLLGPAIAVGIARSTQVRRSMIIVSLGQVVCATALAWAADAAGLRNPAGYLLAITVLVSAVGSFVALVAAPPSRRPGRPLRGR